MTNKQLDNLKYGDKVVCIKDRHIFEDNGRRLPYYKKGETYTFHSLEFGTNIRVTELLFAAEHTYFKLYCPNSIKFIKSL